MGLDVRCEMEDRWDLECMPNLFLPLGIFDSYVDLIQNKLFFGTIRRILNLTNLAVTSWAFSCLLSPGLYGIKRMRGRMMFYLTLVGYKILNTAFGLWLSAFGSWLSAFASWLSAFGSWLSAFGSWL